MNEKLKRAGDVIIGDVVITSPNGVAIDVGPQILSIEIIENIFEPFTTGIVTISDSQNVTNLFPLVGNEFISISFHTPTTEADKHYNKKFYIYAVSDKIKTTDRNSIYQLRIISEEGFRDRTTRVSQTFRGLPHQNIEKIVRSAGLNSSQFIVVEPAINDLVFISNMWNPSKCIDYISRHAINADNAPTYMFFEQRNRFVFMTLDALCVQQPLQQFYVNNWSRQAPTDNINSSAAIDITRAYQSVKQTKYSTSFNQFDRIDQGYYGSTTTGIDISTQQYVYLRNTRKFDEGKHLNKFSPIPNHAIIDNTAYINYVPYMTQNFELQNQGITDTDFLYRAQRQQAFANLMTNHITMQVYGRSDYSVGMVVDVFVPKDQQLEKQEDDPYDHLLSGKYLITSLKHIVTPLEHVCNMQLMKDSYTVDISHSAVANKSSTTGDSVIVV